MDDLISRKVAIKAIESLQDCYNGFSDTFDKACIIGVLDELPSAYPYSDAEIQKMQDLEQAQFDKVYQIGYEEGKKDAQPEIIRCKDCKNSEHWYRDRRRCFLWSEDGVSVFDDGFCNYAERRTDE